jgi:hypothetical protein
MKTECRMPNAEGMPNAESRILIGLRQVVFGFQARLLTAAALVLLCLPAAAAELPKNLFGNPSFEMGGGSWQCDKAGKTECQFAVNDQDAADGKHSALLTIGAVEEWGVQFGQAFAAGDKGKTYTFAVLAKSVKDPVEVSLQIERPAKPWDRAAGAKFKLTNGWQEIHLTFTVDKTFAEGWFAYLACTQPKVQLRADLFRLYEGAYVPYREIARQEAAGVGVRLFDTGKASAVALPGEAFAKRPQWQEIPEDKLPNQFQGDAVFMNDRIACVLRRGARGAEIYALGADGATMRTILAPVAGAEAPKLDSFTIVENSMALGVVDARFTAADGKSLTLRYTLPMGQPFVQTEARSNATALRVEASCRFAVMPDFFADDIVMDATELPVAAAELPSDNFLLQLSPDRQAIVMTVMKTSEEDIRITLSGEGNQRLINGAELRYGKEGKIWVAVLASPAIWHQQDITKAQAGSLITLDWKAPFPAHWRVDWRRAEKVTDSWEMIAERADGNYMKYGMYGARDTIPASRRRWNTVLGDFKYPCWLDKASQGQLQPLKTPVLQFQGPAIIYPINRAPATALDTFTVVDIVRNTLGLGPCEFILDLEGQRSAYKGRATCSVRDTLNPIYAARQQKQRKAEIEKVLEDLMIFVRHIRGRIESYVAFGHETLDYLAAQKKAHPELAEGLSELETLARAIDLKVAARRDKIKTPEEAAKMVAEFRKNVLEDDGAEAPAKCKQYTEAWVEIGGNQDELAGEARWAVKLLRQRAGLLMAGEPRLAEVVKEIRRRSQIVLRNPANHEGAAH